MIRFIELPPFVAQLLGALPALFNDAHGDGIKDEGAVAVPFRALDPADGVGVRGGAQLAAGDAAEVVGDDVVIADALALAVDPVDEIEELDGLERRDRFPRAPRGRRRR